MPDTCWRMSFIEVVALVPSAPGRPSTSHRTFGLRAARARFFLAFSAPDRWVKFIPPPFRRRKNARGEKPSWCHRNLSDTPNAEASSAHMDRGQHDSDHEQNPGNPDGRRRRVDEIEAGHNHADHQHREEIHRYVLTSSGRSLWTPRTHRGTGRPGPTEAKTWSWQRWSYSPSLLLMQSWRSWWSP